MVHESTSLKRSMCGHMGTPHVETEMQLKTLPSRNLFADGKMVGLDGEGEVNRVGSNHYTYPVQNVKGSDVSA